ncbi:MAG: hypothetical protein QHH24_04875 [Candidatus Bathyarchaeota archaeon]|nr:hypothetical protein [Candidatus Bathyarchaeota archaeon]
METLKEETIKPVTSWCRRSKQQKPSVEATFYPELRRWVQHTIIEAERHGNFERKDQLLSLLKDL